MIGVKMLMSLMNHLKTRGKIFYLVVYVFHMAICLYYYYLTKNGITSGDSGHYYMRVLTPDYYYDPSITFGVGSSFIKSIVYVFHSLFDASYLSLFILFATVGFGGFYYFLKTVNELGYNLGNKFLGIHILPFLLFLPNIHMWTVALGKDSLMFFALMLLTYSLVRIRKRYLLLIVAGFIVFMIRPHVFGIVMVALSVTILVGSDIPSVFKLPVLLTFTLVGLFTVNFLVSKIFGRNLSISTVVEILEGRQGYFVKANYSGSMVDTSGYPFIYKMFSYLYRPIFEKINFNYILVSFDNLGSLFVSMSLFSKGGVKWLRQSRLVERFSLIYFILGVSFFSMIFSNFGIAVRQKTMFIYSFYIVILSFLAWRRSFSRPRDVSLSSINRHFIV